ncbi:PadR family transcriptional regulator [Streptomyces sp. NPDC015232]|uniref:PadR family transcriptional regulator n=1 Tax=unclassified Streptomyces TaxID=2593676 RepID=UPI0033A102C3
MRTYGHEFGHGHGPGAGRGPCGPGPGPRGDFEGRRAAFGPFGPGWGQGPWGGRGRGGPGGRGRARRGDVRASILALLKDRPMHGYEMIQEIGERSGGAWKPSPGSVYPTLQMLEDEGLITSASEGGKKLFTLTDAGREEAESGPEAPWEEAGRGVDWEALNEVRQAGFGLMEAFGQVWKTGNAEQRQKAVEVIGEARKKLYLILADEH